MNFRNTPIRISSASRFAATSLLALVLVTRVCAQSDNHDHDHSEEAGHQETHAEHEPHDDHNAHGNEGHDDHDEHGGPIQLEERDMLDFGIRIMTAGPGSIHEELRLPGEVRMNENAMGHVSPRFDGVVLELLHRLGDEVKAGDRLAKMETNDTLRPFDLVAPIDGTIVSYHITPGESLSAGEVAYTIADTTTVWVDLRVYQRDLPKVHKGQKVRVSAGHEYPEMEGSISYIGPVVDEASRTGLIRVVLPNRDELLRPGLFVVGQVLLDEHHLPLVVPRSAVHTLDEANVIFVQAESGEGYEARPVRLGRGDSQSVHIVEGLQRGQRYVSEGGFFLKADSQKENFGDGHDH
jgi:cobalt-zinc-cadmium efflux system membrane fusion protein